MFSFVLNVEGVYSPGLSIDEIQEKYGLSRVVKMASNENPLGTSPVVQEAIKAHAALSFRYPRSGNPALRQAIAVKLGVGAESVVAGNGSDEIIDLLIRVLCRPGQDNIVAFKPCFSIYGLQARLCGVEFRQASLNPDFGFDWEGLLSLVDEQTKIVFVTNPDNPSGHSVMASELAGLLGRLPETALLVVDEAYVDFARPVEAYSSLGLLDSDRVAVLRTFSKLFGLAGLRLGHGVMPAELAKALLSVRLPFSVNIMAEAAGMAALEDEAFIQTTLEVVQTGRERLTQGLKDLGCRVWPSQANFLMFRPPVPADGVFEALLRQGIIIRPLTSYDLSELLRVSVGTAEENEMFLTAMSGILGLG
ncbi:MAG: histidinol-phosphate transaminase [Deltaproteobacteria bacterium]|nr:histidinol-phosphate transaminase [Deltaproteobacteria bacterium]